MELREKNIVVVYEAAQIEQMLLHMEQQGIPRTAYTFIPLEFEVERILQEQKLPYVSLPTYVPLSEEFEDVIDAARSSARRFAIHAAMRFYSYQRIKLGEVFEPMLDMYLEYFGRYIRIFKSISDKVEISSLYIPYSSRAFSVSGAALTVFEIRAPVDAAQAVGRKKGFAVHAVGEPARALPADAGRRLPKWIALKALGVYNTCISLFVRRRPIKIYASEYWSHVDSFVSTMDDVELVFMERSEMKNIPLRELLKHRIRFVHPESVIDARTRSVLSQEVQTFSSHWRQAKEEVQEAFAPLFHDNAWPEIEEALTYLIEVETIRALIDIEGLRRVLTAERPDKVLLRASIGGSAHHFFIATQIAHQLGIPSIELQHAGAIVDPRSIHSHLTASYLAAYGSLIGKTYEINHGYAGERLRAIGSPRFDHYVRERDRMKEDRAECLTKIGLDPAQPVVFVAVPFAGSNPLLLSSYQVAAFFKDCRYLQEHIPGLQFIFKFRPGSFSRFYREYFSEVFTNGGVVGTDTSDFLPLIVASDMALTGRSTLMYEIMLGRRPVILYPWQKWDTYTLNLYNRAAPMAENKEELLRLSKQLLDKQEAEKAVVRQDSFLSNNYSFDGNAPDRMAAMLREKLHPLP